MRDIVRDLPVELPRDTEEEPFVVPNLFIKSPNAPAQPWLEGLRYAGLQLGSTGVSAPPITLAFDAISEEASNCNCLPPDTNGDISDQHFIQWVNKTWAVYNKADGSVVQAATPGNSFWVGFGGRCENSDDGDPIALWDAHAQRWVMSQFVRTSPFAQCVAVSTTSDPLGTYYRYEFDWPVWGDYPKLGIWTDDTGTQDAYLLTTHEFNPQGTTFLGAALIAMQRDKMLTGDPTAAIVRFPGIDAYGIQPVNLIGTLNAPGNACPTYVHFDAATSDYLFWDLCLNWAAPLDSTFSQTPTRIAGETFIPYPNAVSQLNSTQTLAAFGANTMYRATARAFPPDAPTRVSLVVNHTVLGNVQQGGIKWVHFNLDDRGVVQTQPTPLYKQILDQGVYAPDSNTRWMGGIAIDGSGNIGVGYSVSSTSMNPQIETSGRTLNDVAGTLEDEQNCTAGIANGSQFNFSGRWGDYSSMSVDPVDQCTFYYTSEYYPLGMNFQWHTRVCSFKFSGCGQPDYAVVANTPKRVEMCGATASADPSYGLRIGVLNGFTGPVTLAAVGAPAGSVATFSTSPVNAPGTSNLTLSGGAMLPSGDYSFSIAAMNAGTTRSIALQLGISAAPAPQPVLFAPSNGAVDASVRALLSWDHERIFGDGFDGGQPLPLLAGVLSYTVEVATDAAFTNIATSATVTTTSWPVDIVLANNTHYFWRVTPHNFCGDGPTSATFSFTTGVPGQCPAGTTASTVYENDFDSGADGWIAGGTGAVGWTQGPPPAGAGFSTSVWQVPDNATTSDRTLTSPAIAIPASVQQVILSYDAYHNSEQNGPGYCYDTSSMEISTNGTSFNYLDGSHMVTDPYNGAASGTTPLGNRQGWCFPGPAGATQPTHAIVDLGGFAGRNVAVRYRMVSDSNTSVPAPNGLIIDHFLIQTCR